MNEVRCEAIDEELRRFALPPAEVSWADLAREVLARWHPNDEHPEDEIRNVLAKLVLELAAEKWKKAFRARKTRRDAVRRLADWRVERQATSAVPRATIIAELENLRQRKKEALLLLLAAGLSLEQIASITDRKAQDVENDVRKAMAKVSHRSASVALDTHAVAHQPV